MSKLGVNIDHVATLRQARGGVDPNPITAALICENAGADSIVAHLREDRRHINDQDVYELKQSLKGRFNLEMSLNLNIIKVALSIKPDQVTIVPERRQELTTEGGLDVVRQYTKIRKTFKEFQKNNIDVSLFIAPVAKQIKRTKDTGITTIELHTGDYALARTKLAQDRELKRIEYMAAYAKTLGLTVNAGHGLNYDNVRAVAQIHEIDELNIGHSIVSRAVYVGIGNAVKEMLQLIKTT